MPKILIMTDKYVLTEKVLGSTRVSTGKQPLSTLTKGICVFVTKKADREMMPYIPEKDACVDPE